MTIKLKSRDEIELMRRAGQIVAEVLSELKDAIKPGIKTQELDEIAHCGIRKRGGVASFKGYRGFPSHLCVSINDQIVHGIPGERILKEGDIVSLDLGVIFQGYHGDAAITVGVGEISAEAERLISAAKGSLEVGIDVIEADIQLGDISYAIQRYAESRGYGVVREYTGHGIGRKMHEEPSVPNFGTPASGLKLKPGMVIALEPMLNIGGWPTRIGNDGWTVYTADGSLSAHVEHTVAVTTNGPYVLTVI
jgi:methionyl aminopeptidase